MITWLRHGQSTWNAIDRMQGREASPPLTELGRLQALAAATRLEGGGHTRVLTSPAVRATQTAEIVAGHLGLTVDTDDLLVEKGLDESPLELLGRIRRVLDAVGDEPVLVVSHGDLIGMAVGMLSGRRPELPANAQITSVDPTTRHIAVILPLEPVAE